MQFHRYLNSLAAAAFFLITILTPAEASKDPVRVGYVAPTSMEVSAYRGHSYYANYLDELSKYMDWEYDTIPVQPHEAMQKLQSGQIDLLMPIENTPNTTPPNVVYSASDYARSLLGFYSRYGESRFRSSDLSTLIGTRVGLLAHREDATKSYELFCTTNELHMRDVFFESHDELLAALKNGTVDLVLDSAATATADEKFLLAFDGVPMRIAALDKNLELIEQINAAT